MSDDGKKPSWMAETQLSPQGQAPGQPPPAQPQGAPQPPPNAWGQPQAPAPQNAWGQPQAPAQPQWGQPPQNVWGQPQAPAPQQPPPNAWGPPQPQAWGQPQPQPQEWGQPQPPPPQWSPGPAPSYGPPPHFAQAAATPGAGPVLQDRGGAALLAASLLTTGVAPILLLGGYNLVQTSFAFLGLGLIGASIGWLVLARRWHGAPRVLAYVLAVLVMFMSFGVFPVIGDMSSLEPDYLFRIGIGLGVIFALQSGTLVLARRGAPMPPVVLAAAGLSALGLVLAVVPGLPLMVSMLGAAAGRIVLAAAVYTSSSMAVAAPIRSSSAPAAGKVELSGFVQPFPFAVLAALGDVGVVIANFTTKSEGVMVAVAFAASFSLALWSLCAARNARALGAGQLRFSPGIAFLTQVLPLANVLAGSYVFQELWTRSYGAQIQPQSGLIKVTFRIIVFGFLSVFVMQFVAMGLIASSTGPPNPAIILLVQIPWLVMVGGFVLRIVAAFLICGRQNDAYRRLSVQG